jgi:AcrR family transcriptional regulator
MAVKIQPTKPTRSERNDVGAASALRENVRTFKRETIHNAAIEIFYSNGYQNSTVDNIAEAMSVTKAVVYYNFSSKEEVLEKIIDRTIALTHESVDQGIAAGRTPAQKLALLCFFYAGHILKNQKMVAVYFREERSFSTALRRRISMLEKSVDEKVSAILDAGILSGAFHVSDTRLMAITIMAMISIAFHWYRESGRLSAEVLSQHFSEQALRLAGFNGDLGLEEAMFKLPHDRA